MFVGAYGYKKWADDRTLRAIQQIDRVVNKKFYAFALQQINHMVIVEELFRSRLTNEPAPHESTNTKLVPVFNELERRLMASCEWFSGYVSKLTHEQDSISFVFADGKLGKMTKEEILFHIVNHGSYHRGNIAHALDMASVPHPIDGYGIYVHEVEPSRRNSK